ncbi:MAG: hypothetical protein K9L17_08325 [Clostridiales bacterium]|nr:hypothetical protein [Clostridiales bacterium]MCF8022681.1 hypothetical protein [Clostridiales bacterium]
MLDRLIASYGTIGLLIFTVVLSAFTIGMIGQWYMIQNQAQFLASSQAKYGGYTLQAERSLNQFIDDLNLDKSRLDIDISAPASKAPVVYSKVVKAKITYNFKFGIGNWFQPFTVPLTGRGRAVSTYLPNTYSVVYTSP